MYGWLVLVVLEIFMSSSFYEKWHAKKEQPKQKKIVRSARILDDNGQGLSRCNNALAFAFHCKVIAGTRKFESCLTQGASSESYPDRDFLAEDVSAVNELNLDQNCPANHRNHRLQPGATFMMMSSAWDHHIAALPTDLENGSVKFTD